MSKNGKCNASPLFKILFLKYLDLFKTDFFCTVQIKDSCIVHIENKRFYLFFLRLIWDFARDWLQQKMSYVVLVHFNVDFTQKWLREKPYLCCFPKPTLCCILSFCACGVIVGANLLLHFLVFDRVRMAVTVEADILSSLIVFYNWFWKRATAEADLLGSCRKYILSSISYVSCWRSTEPFYIFLLVFQHWWNIVTQAKKKV